MGCGKGAACSAGPLVSLLPPSQKKRTKSHAAGSSRTPIHSFIHSTKIYWGDYMPGADDIAATKKDMRQAATPCLHRANCPKAESDGKQGDKTMLAGDKCTWKIKQGRGWKFLGSGGGLCWRCVIREGDI